MKNWWVVFIACAVVIGCGGSGGAGGGGAAGGGAAGGGAAGGADAFTVPAVDLDGASNLQVVFKSGQGRRDVGSQVAQFRTLRVQNGPANIFPSTLQGGTDGIYIQLDGYTSNAFNAVDAFQDTFAQKDFTEFPIEVSAMYEVSTSGLSQYPVGVFQNPTPMGANVRMFPGRQSTVVINLNDSILYFDDDSDTVVFDEDLFALENYGPGEDFVQGFVSDMISFDISGMASGNRPSLDSGAKATRALFSGDLAAAAAGFDTPGSFELFGQGTVVTGVFRAEQVIQGGLAQGAYSVLEIDPRDAGIPPTDTITEFQGLWRKHTDVLLGMGQYTLILLPPSRDDRPHQAVAFRTSGGAIADLWFGTATFTISGGNPTGGTLKLYPVAQLASGSTANELTATLSGLIVQTDEGGSKIVKAGTFTNTTTPAGWTMPTSGPFGVLRR